MTSRVLSRIELRGTKDQLMDGVRNTCHDFERDSSLLVGISMYHEQADYWTLHISEMEENLELVFQKPMNEL